MEKFLVIRVGWRVRKQSGRAAAPLVAWLACGMLSVLAGCAGAGRGGEVRLAYTTGYETPSEVCPAIAGMFNALPARLRSDRPGCHWRLAAIPEGFPDFALPDWQPWPAQEVTFEAVSGIWKSNYLRRYRLSDRSRSLDQLLEKDGILDGIRRDLNTRSFTISQASIDLDGDGEREVVLRLDNRNCTYSDGTPARLPNYPLYSVIRDGQPLDPHKFFSSELGSELVVFKGKPVILKFALPARSPKTFMEMSVHGLARPRGSSPDENAFFSFEQCVLHLDRE